MSRNYLPISQITDETRNWTALIQVVERAPIQTSKNDPNVLYRRYLFTDGEGTKVSAVVYRAAMGEFNGLLLPYKRNYLTGAKVRPETPLYQVGPYEFNWLLHKKTLVEEFQEEMPPQLPCQIEIHTFADVHKYADTDNPRNLLGVIVHAFPIKTLGQKNTIRDLVIVNEEEKPLILTLWNQFETEDDVGQNLANTIASGNIVLSMRIKVTTFNGLSLSTKTGTCLMINPPIPAALRLKQWYTEKKADVAKLLEENVYKNTDKLFPFPTANDIISVQRAVTTIKYTKTCWIAGKLKYLGDNKSLWTATCNNCRKNYNVPPNTPVKCRSCKEETHVEARCRLPIAIEDETGIIHAMLYDSDAERVIPFNGTDLYQADQQGVDLSAQITAAMNERNVVCFLKHYESTHHTVLKLYTIDGMHMDKPLIQPKEAATHEVASSSSKVKDKQLFSPTLKNVLNSLTPEHQKSTSTASSESSVKKRITFEEHQSSTPGSSIPFSQVPESSSEQTHPPSALYDANPTKKSRPKMD